MAGATRRSPAETVTPDLRPLRQRPSDPIIKPKLETRHKEPWPAVVIWDGGGWDEQLAKMDRRGGKITG
jgi:hypothetical protein